MQVRARTFRLRGSLALALALLLDSGAARAQTSGFAPRSEPPAFEELIEDVAENPAYTPEARDILIEQADGGFEDFVTTNPIQTQIGNWPLEAFEPLPNAPLALERIFLVDSYDGGIVESTCPPAAPCEFPDEWDIKAFRVYTVWRASSPSDIADLERHFLAQDGRGVRMWLEGQELSQAFGGTFSPGDFHAYVPPSTDQLVIVFRPHAWYPAAPPWPVWNIYFQLTEENGLPLIDLDRWGNPIVVGHVANPTSHRSATVVPKPVLRSFWTATIGESVSSSRCTGCHTMDTPEKIRERHGGLIDGLAIVTEPSILVPGKSVYTCSNCHEGYFDYLGESSSFAEGKWATPTQELDINWAQIINDHPLSWPHRICDRMVTNMPTHELRHEHFHEDARLFWAVEKGELPDPNLPPLPTAPPHDHDEFVRRFDVWNDSGAHCPPLVPDLFINPGDLSDPLPSPIGGVERADADEDGVPDADDNCPAASNPRQLDADGDGRGDFCECGDQTLDGLVDVRDVLAINDALFGRGRISPLCDANGDGQCSVADILGVNAAIHGAPAYCSRHPDPARAR